MASDGTGTAFDITLPQDSANVSDVPIEIREVKAEVKVRADKEHVAYAGASVGGEHKQGSAVAYFGTSFPTVRPDGSTAFSVSDKGRFYVKSTDGSLYYLDNSGNWQLVTLNSLDSIADGLIDKTKVASGFTQGILPLAVVTDQKASGSDAGTFTTGSWQTRVLNTEVCDNGSILTVTSNQINLNAGTYRIKASAPAQQCGFHQIRWMDITNTNVIAYGTSESSPASGGYVTRSQLSVEFTVSADSTVFELQHRCSITKAGSGLGLAGSFGGTEVYAMVEIQKLL